MHQYQPDSWSVSGRHAELRAARMRLCAATNPDMNQSMQESSMTGPQSGLVHRMVVHAVEINTNS
jgi:hypothetical protein